MNYDAINALIGSPWVYVENDCYAVVKKALKSVFGVSVPDIALPDVSNPRKNSALFEQQSNSRYWKKVDSPKPGCVVLFYNKHDTPFHCGLYIERGDVLHCWGSPKIQGSTVCENLSKMNKSVYKKYEFYKYAYNENS